MSLEENKRIAREFVEASVFRDTARIEAVAAEDATLDLQGNNPRFSRSFSRSEWCKYLETPSPFIDRRIDLKIRSVTAEEDRVSVESETYGVVEATGRVYNNKYHYLFTIRDGRVANVREYMDTQHVHDILIAPAD